MLIYFIADYLRNPELQLRASEDPVTVLAEYGIALDMQQAFRRHDHAAIVKTAHDELAALLSRSSLRGHHVMMWGTPRITVTSVSPSTTKADSFTPLTIEGSSFPPAGKARLSFRNEQSNDCVDGTIASVTTDPHGRSKLLGKVKLPRSGLWKVSVASVGNPDGAGVWDGDFKVTAG
ncbi:uncharacterized protein SOCEGT47_083050 [Sorangium cellulosum]|uniref:Uncharacterized protein n=1 Tax=Sorangium cellulosum TaxID=56 RepID=A0A4P2QD61_SORCE|nr:hypothetical protein [Sorangium cellulosum]AUX27707.1 uncharacterized protein SOCEGT47_083050 [Sorangium cellulosum]